MKYPQPIQVSPLTPTDTSAGRVQHTVPRLTSISLPSSKSFWIWLPSVPSGTRRSPRVSPLSSIRVQKPSSMSISWRVWKAGARSVRYSHDDDDLGFRVRRRCHFAPITIQILTNSRKEQIQIQIQASTVTWFDMVTYTVVTILNNLLTARVLTKKSTIDIYADEHHGKQFINLPDLQRNVQHPRLMLFPR